MKKIILLLFCLITSIVSLNAQEAITVTGGDASGSGGSVSSSIGQIGYTSVSGLRGSVAEGVQQPYTILSLFTFGFLNQTQDTTSNNSGNIADTPVNFDLYYTAYPNPTSDQLFLKVENYSITDLSYQLYDLNGKLLEIKKLLTHITAIDMINYKQSTYILRVIDKNQEVKTFKIIKN